MMASPPVKRRRPAYRPGLRIRRPGTAAHFSSTVAPAASSMRLRLLGVLLGDLLENRLRRRVDEVLRLFQAEAGEGTDLLDDLDLLVAGGGEDDVELVLLLLGGGLGRAAAGSCGAPRPRPARRR